MEIRLLNEGYGKDDLLYDDFINNNISTSASYFSDKSVYIKEAPDFPIYIGKGTNSEKREHFREAISILTKYYISTKRDVHLNGLFWHSLLISKKREYLVQHYPQILEDRKTFNNIVLKAFDWENYVYKCVLAAEYINDAAFESEEEKFKYIDLIYSNLDIYNYTIKYSIFRNSKFIINLLTVIDQEDLSIIFKAKIDNRPDLGKDERYGRRVIFELNKNYPIIMSPFLEVDELKEEVMKALEIYL